MDPRDLRTPFAPKNRGLDLTCPSKIWVELPKSKNI